MLNAHMASMGMGRKKIYLNTVLNSLGNGLITASHYGSSSSSSPDNIIAMTISLRLRSLRSLSLSRPNTLSPQLRSRSARPLPLSLSLFASRRFPSFHSEVHNHVRGCVNLASLLKRNLGSRTVCIRVSCGKSERERVLDGRGGKSSLCSVDGIDRGRN